MNKNNQPKVINVKSKELEKIGYKNLEEWLKDPMHEYVGRDMTWAVKGSNGSKWQNPFKINDYGIEGCLKKYEEYLLNNEELFKNIKELKGKDLGCWCVPYHGCHAQILLKYANDESEKEKINKDKIEKEMNFPKLGEKQNEKLQKPNAKIISYKSKLTE